MYTYEQLNAIENNHRHIVCLACAGSGKTTVLLERIRGIIKNGNNPQSILVLTFTNAAAREMKQRYIRKYSGNNIPTFCTFHSFCYQLMLSDSNIRHHLGYKQIPMIADESKIKQMETTAKLQTNCKLSKSKLNGTTPLQPKDKFIYDVYNKALQSLYIKNNLITFDTLLKSISQLFIEDNCLIQPYKSQYDYILVDEFQDTSYEQWDFVRSFQNSSIFVCGDIAQNIYSFRGTTSKIIKDLTQDNNWLTIKLTTNFRSTQQICDYANNIFKDQDNPISMHAICTGDEVIQNTLQYIPYMRLGDSCKIQDIATSIQALKGTCAVLCRTNKEVQTISDYLEDLGISVDSSQMYKDYAQLLSSVYDNDYMVDWLSSLLPIDTYENYIRRCKLYEDKSKLELLVNTDTTNDIRHCINVIVEMRKLMKDSNLPNTLRFQYILKLLEISCGFDESLVLDDTLNAKQVLDSVNRYIQSINRSTIYVGTVHSVKGLEFDNVFVIGIYGPTWDIDKEDNRNLFYVACTRAKDNLYVYRGKT